MTDLRIVECVPNFSEGSDRSVIDQIAAAMAGVEGARVLDVDPGKATNRTVVTVVGPPQAVLDAAFAGIAEAARLIDMSRHHGEHPRIGATDVCPFVPVRGVTMDECAALARRLGERVGAELGIPVWLYEAAATSPARRNLADIRAGEYEGLELKLADPAWRPDFGPSTMNRRSGATVIGARKFLVAYNVNLNTRSKKTAGEIAFEVREQGRAARGPDGKILKDATGNTIHRPGRLRAVKAVGWTIEEYRRAQVSVNLTDYELSGLHDVFDACDDEARKLGVRVTGSELVGLVPLDALLRAGRHYLRKQGRSGGIPECEIVEAAVQSLGLSEIAPFVTRDRVIEYRLGASGPSLVERTVRGFVDELSSDSPAPGGGSVAALVASLGAALCAMVANLTVGKKGMESAFASCDAAAVRAQALKDELLRTVDDDTAAFDAFVAAGRLAKGTLEEQRVRADALLNAIRRAVAVPAMVVAKSLEVIELAELMLERGNPNAASDAATAAACALAAAEGAHFNVLTNLNGFAGTPDWVVAARTASEGALARLRPRAEAVMAGFRARMG